ncbi:hypothetical protein EVAR_33174_1 [Eumeta japonica]|uniref:Histone-lysine N-methyltransferase SETMAR n=1 Tax=Eumeta variegata TaxID=151549 RepID=A0A4C1W3J0_EUMVA|nr:hypothetical protein EVAR_33174_1 [Eumeta japonica]
MLSRGQRVVVMVNEEDLEDADEIRTAKLRSVTRMRHLQIAKRRGSPSNVTIVIDTVRGATHRAENTRPNFDGESGVSAREAVTAAHRGRDKRRGDALEISVKAGPSTANLEVPPKRKRGRKNIFDERLSASLDFAKLSDRKATVVLTSTLKVQPNTPLTVHWDGKLIEDITGHKTVDRLPILVSGQGVDQLWLSQNSVMELGRTEDRKDALWLACRHHIMEIVLEAVVVQALGPSSGPEILIFKRFRSAWPSIDQRKFSIVSSDPDALRYVQNIADSTISFAKSANSEGKVLILETDEVGAIGLARDHKGSQLNERAALALHANTVGTDRAAPARGHGTLLAVAGSISRNAAVIVICHLLALKIGYASREISRTMAISNANFPLLLSVKVAQNWFKRFQSGNFDFEECKSRLQQDEPCPSRPVTDEVDAILEKVQQDRHISSYDIAEELGIDRKTVLTHLKKAEHTKKAPTRAH